MCLTIHLNIVKKITKKSSTEEEKQKNRELNEGWPYALIYTFLIVELQDDLLECD